MEPNAPDAGAGPQPDSEEDGLSLDILTAAQLQGWLEGGEVPLNIDGGRVRPLPLHSLQIFTAAAPMDDRLLVKALHRSARRVEGITVAGALS